MTSKAEAPQASFAVRCFLALHATVPAAMLVAMLVHLWPPAGLAPLAQRPAWAVWTLIATWLITSLLAAWALRHLALWRVSLCAAGALLGLVGAAGLVLGAPLQWPMLASLVALGVVLAGLAAFIGPARTQANRRRDTRRDSNSPAPRSNPRWRWPAMPSTQTLSFWLAGLLTIEAFRIAHIVAAEPSRSAGMLGLLVAFFLVLPAATLQAWWPRAAAVLAALAAAALAGLAWRSGMGVWAIGAALCLAMGIAVLRRLQRQGLNDAAPAPGKRPVEGAV
ncbi:hypothetical protein [Acidovorax sp. CCYZU-2555]|uniref:hypothetical protein n=1 Tax=Acidovorax sp. CCYZU-2555 TaxID=2835042 RepID=UPI001BCF8FE5|nr:hypothetical protein [Acidovorax sp. CCYZU-2555]MBS7776768.1 hypothetical protein [Acidovorax sp. CCYZU-2555]